MEIMIHVSPEYEAEKDTFTQTGYFWRLCAWLFTAAKLQNVIKFVFDCNIGDIIVNLLLFIW